MWISPRETFVEHGVCHGWSRRRIPEHHFLFYDSTRIAGPRSGILRTPHDGDDDHGRTRAGGTARPTPAPARRDVRVGVRGLPAVLCLARGALPLPHPVRRPDLRHAVCAGRHWRWISLPGAPPSAPELPLR